MDPDLRELAVKLFDIRAFRFGEFVTEIGEKTAIFFDLRVLVSYPKIMTRLARTLLPFVEECPNVAQICGASYRALPLTTLISINSNVPMLIKRKETKTYGTKKIIEGKFKPGDSCVIIEDIVTTGSSVLETADILRKEGLIVTEAIVAIYLDRDGKKNLENHGIKMRCLFRTEELWTYISTFYKYDIQTFKDVCSYLSSTTWARISRALRLTMPFHVRVDKCKNAIGSKLFNLMESKQSTICLAADLTKADAVIELADLVGPHIVLLKTHVDILEDFSDNFIKRLKELAKKHDFLLMEDRKFADIGNTVCLQYEKGIYKIAQWADVVTVHAITGQSIIDGFKNSVKNINEPRGLFILAEMSSEEALTTGDYVQNALSIAEISDMVVGVVCQSNIFPLPGHIQLSPGVKLVNSSDDVGQQYNTPESVVNSGADLVAVGRGITEAEDKLAATLKYKEELWAAYIKRISEWREAMTLYQRSAQHAKDALEYGKILPESLEEALEKLEISIEGAKYTAHAHSVLEDGQEEESGVNKYTKTKKPLHERLHEYREDNALLTKQPNVYKLPPSIQPISCKPLFFDLAFNMVEFPDLSEKLGNQTKKGGQAGLTGFVKDLWGWGNK